MPGSGAVEVVTVAGVRVACHERGEGRPLVFVHGLAGSAVTWREVTARLATRFRTLAIDLMGCGRSDKPIRESYTLGRQAELVRGFVDALGLADAVLVGHSYGGAVCMLAAREPWARVTGLVLVDSLCYPQPVPPALRLLSLPGLGPLALWLVPKTWAAGAGLAAAYGGRRRPLAEVVAANAYALRSRAGRHALIETVRGIAALPRKPLTDFAALGLPTLVIWGERDPVIPLSLGERLAGEIPGAELVLVPGVGHLPQEEAGEETAEAIGRFLGAIPRPMNHRP